MEQTAVEWLEGLLKVILYNLDEDELERIQSVINDAKEIEKSQIINAWGESRSGLEYYNRVYKKE
jgi:hypothetical protein